MTTPWRPSTDLAALQARAALYRHIHQFFAERGVLEVTTPQLARYPVTDPNIDCIEVPGYGFLQSSPEYHMKRLLAADSGPIYQISHAFRDGEAGQRHNPEFTLLEWYRPGFDLQALIDECCQLLSAVLAPKAVEHTTVRTLFQQTLALDPLTCPEAALADAAGRPEGLGPMSRAQWVDYLMATRIEPELPAETLTVVSAFPGWAAALAQTKPDHDGEPIALRFECYFRGLELANGYQELTDAREQAQRFSRDCTQREAEHKAIREPDPYLLDALTQGLPDCAGVAIGLERVLMAAGRCGAISEVLPFPVDRA